MLMVTQQDKIISLKKRQAQLAARQQELDARVRQAERKIVTRKKIIIGTAVLAHVARHPAFAETLKDILQAAVMRDDDRLAIADLLLPQAAAASGAADKAAE